MTVMPDGAFTRALRELSSNLFIGFVILGIYRAFRYWEVGAMQSSCIGDLCLEGWMFNLDEKDMDLGNVKDTLRRMRWTIKILFHFDGMTVNPPAFKIQIYTPASHNLPTTTCLSFSTASLPFKMVSWFALLLLIFPLSTTAQLTGPVGPTTPLWRKSRECNILAYGAVADNATNVAPAIHAAFTHCVLRHPGSTLVVPKGNYLTTEDIVLANATNWAFRLDGLITA